MEVHTRPQNNAVERVDISPKKGSPSSFLLGRIIQVVSSWWSATKRASFQSVKSTIAIHLTPWTSLLSAMAIKKVAERRLSLPNDPTSMPSPAVTSPLMTMAQGDMAVSRLQRAMNPPRPPPSRNTLGEEAFTKFSEKLSNLTLELEKAKREFGKVSSEVAVLEASILSLKTFLEQVENERSYNKKLSDMIYAIEHSLNVVPNDDQRLLEMKKELSSLKELSDVLLEHFQRAIGDPKKIYDVLNSNVFKTAIEKLGAFSSHYVELARNLNLPTPFGMSLMQRLRLALPIGSYTSAELSETKNQFADLLIEPAQRMARYQLPLQETLKLAAKKNSGVSEENIQYLKNSLEIVKITVGEATKKIK